MKCAIFCSMAFCAFQAVFADDSAKDGTGAKNGDDETKKKLYDVTDKLENSFWKATTSVTPNGKDDLEIDDYIGNCLKQTDSANQKYTSHFNTAAAKCSKCYEKVKKTKNTELANKCCGKAVAAFKKAEKPRYDKGLACVAKCVKLGDDCLEMLKKLPV